MTDTPKLEGPEVEYEVWQNGEWCASADRLSDAQHYMAMYGQDGPVKAKTAFTYRVDGFTSSAPPSPIAAGEDPHEMFEAFLAEAIATSPKPLQELGRFLSDLLGEDDWKTADRYLIALATIRADAWRALTEIADRPLIQEPKQGDYGKDRERCPSCRHAWHVDEQPHHALSCERMLATKVLSASPARGEGDASAGRSRYVTPEEIRDNTRFTSTNPVAPSPGEGDAPVAWRGPNEVPDAPSGGYAYKVVAVKRARSGKVYSFGAFYLNAMSLWFDEDDEERPVTGWNTDREGDDTVLYDPLLSAGDELMGWCDFPSFTHPTPATPAGEDLREALQTALNRVAYQPGDHPVVPIKHAAFVEEVRAILAALQPQAEGGGGHDRGER